MITPTETILRNRTEGDTRTYSRRGWVIIGIICVIAIFLIVFFTTDLKYLLIPKPVSTHLPTSPNITRWKIFGNYSGPGVFVFLTGNKIDEPLCYSAGSALLSGLPVVVAGYQMPFHGSLSKFDYMERAIENAGLKPEDVIIVTDSDTLFMDPDIYYYLTHISGNSAETPDGLDVRAVRKKDAVAPFLVSSEVLCNAPDVFDSPAQCASAYETAYTKIRDYDTARRRYNLCQVYDEYPNRHLNPGVVIARVWAYKEFLQTARNFTRTQNPVNPSEEWSDEQSVYTALYLDLITWEVEQDVFSIPLNKRQASRSPYGLRAGLIGIDFLNRFSATSTPNQQFKFEMNDTKWWHYLPNDESELPYTQNITDILDVSQFVSRLYKRAYNASGERIYESESGSDKNRARKTTREHDIVYTPSIFTMSMMPKNSRCSTRVIYPSIFHTTDSLEGFTKRRYMEVVSIGAPWFVPMVYDEEAKDKAVRYLESEPLFLSTSDSVLRDSYYARCGFPYKRIIKDVEDYSGSSVFSGQ